MEFKNFYLGTHEPHWLEKVTVPLFVSDRRLRRKKNYKPATTNWSLDSGGFSELSMYGKWTITENESEYSRFEKLVSRLRK